MPILALILLVVLGVIAWIMVRHRHASRRSSVLEQPFSPVWEEWLDTSLPLYLALPKELREELHGHINVFLSEKQFHGCDGLEITDEIRVIVTAQACLLLLGRKTNYFPGFRNILVYPGSYVVRQVIDDGVLEHLGEDVRAGESWRRGPVVLAWDDVLRGASDPAQGYNVVLHEFAHKLDEENELAQGVPILGRDADYESWSSAFGAAFEALLGEVDRSETTTLDPYAAHSPAEFFAVATETFFGKPRELRDKHPRLYEQLERYYCVNPCQWNWALLGRETPRNESRSRLSGSG